MSSLHSLQEPLGRVLDCARRIAEVPNSILNNTGGDSALDEIRRLRRDLPHLVMLALASLRGADEIQVADLQHHLNAVKEDAEVMAVWIGPKLDEIQKIWKIIGTAEDVDKSGNVRWSQAREKAFADCQQKKQVIYESCNRANTTANAICRVIDKAVKDAQTAKAKAESEAKSKPDPERDDLLAQADAEQAAIEENRRRSKEQHEAMERCRAANARLVEAIRKLQLAVYSESSATTTDTKPFFPAIRDELLEVCHLLKDAGLEQKWRQARIDPRNLIASDTSGSLTETTFKWAKRLLNQGFDGTSELNDIRTTWEKPKLRGALRWMQLLINWLLGELRLDELPDESCFQTPPPNCPGCGSPPAALDVDDICPSCRAYFYKCGQIPHRVAGSSDHTFQQIDAPIWTRIPPSQVKSQKTIDDTLAEEEKPPHASAKNAKKKRSGPKRNREPRTVTLLLALLDDRRNANLSITELADKLEVHRSSVSRAFHHKKYGPILLKRYTDYGISPPRIREI